MTPIDCVGPATAADRGERSCSGINVERLRARNAVGQLSSKRWNSSGDNPACYGRPFHGFQPASRNSIFCT